MKEADYPSLYQGANKTSLQAQRVYIRLFRLDLIFIIGSSALAIYGFQDNNYETLIYSLSGVLLLAGIILTFIVKNQKFEDVWYKGRALAESVKTLSWRFMIGSENFEKNIPDNNVNEIFLNRIKELAEEFTDFNQHLDTQILTLPNITELMKEIRNKSLQDRKAFYLEYRIKDQKKWYSSKAEYNKKKQSLWFIIILIGQFLGICSAVFMIKFPASSWNIVSLFTTISAAAIAWLQLKQHQELKQAYTTAVLELNFIEEKIYKIQTEQDLSKYVLDSENAISREHTLWLAQKRK